MQTNRDHGRQQGQMPAGNRAVPGTWTQRRGPGVRASSRRWSPALVNVVGLLALCFLTGGSSRGDVASLILLRPIAMLSLFYGLWAISRTDLSRHRLLFGMAGAILALVVVHLIPLPPAIWQNLGGRGIILDIDAAMGSNGIWRPIGMSPEFAWNALYSLTIPLAILVNAIRLTTGEQRIVMIAVVAGGALSILFGLVQLASNGEPAAYLYQRSTFGMASGLFANRNHQALLLSSILPLFAFLAHTSEARGRRGRITRFLAYAGVLVTVTFLIILGSRIGLVTGTIGLAWFILSMLSKRRKGQRGNRWISIIVGTGTLALCGMVAAWAAFQGSSETIHRTLDSDSQDLRYLLWPIIINALPQFLPFGTGVGAYEVVFQMLEPDSILRPTYSNHAHNDWLEIAFTAGAPGIALMAVAVIAYLVAARRALRLPAGIARETVWTGLVIILMAGIGSAVDYPLRTPILSALFSLACVWVASNLRFKDVESASASDI